MDELLEVLILEKIHRHTIMPTNNFGNPVYNNVWCWRWNGPFGNAYPRIWINKVKKNFYVHRVLFEINHGDMPKEIDHECRNAWCVNPAHHREVTHKENIANRNPREKCNKGHLYAKVGYWMYTFPHGRKGRICNKCTPKKATGEHLF